MIGIYVAATVVALIQYLRLRDRRLLPLAALFTFQILALSRERADVWRLIWQGAACASGLLLLLVLTLRHPAADEVSAPDKGPVPDKPPAGSPAASRNSRDDGTSGEPPPAA